MIRVQEERQRGSCTSFRLLNSEIGNDQDMADYLAGRKKSFRLLNSEIGNDLDTDNVITKIESEFSSP